MGKILITGGGGFIGRKLIERLLSAGNEVLILSRSNRNIPGVTCIQWDPYRNEIDTSALSEIDAVVLLAGEGIAASRWNTKVKQRLVDSRVITTRFLSSTLAKVGAKPKVVVAVTGIGIYADGRLSEITEADTPASNYLGRLGVEWEEAIATFEMLGSRIVINRCSMVLGEDSEALKKIRFQLNFGIGGLPGGGSFLMPWCHVDDLTNLMVLEMENAKFQGVYNMVSPHVPTWKEMIRIIADKCNKWVLLIPVPTQILFIVLGEIAKYLFMSMNVSSARLRDTEFVFKYERLEDAMQNICHKNEISSYRLYSAY